MNKRTGEKLFSFANSSVIPIITMQPGPIKSKEKIKGKDIPSIYRQKERSCYIQDIDTPKTKATCKVKTEYKTSMYVH
ncbi:hypothetical protein EfmAA290_17620 [Enterococcus faecium]|nr:hypothetical protein EfmAA290_17620 [Enterococcus faecium]